MNIANIVQWFEKAVPSPSPKNQTVQIGCHFEEVLEMVQSMGLADWRVRTLTALAQTKTHP